MRPSSLPFVRLMGALLDTVGAGLRYGMGLGTALGFFFKQGMIRHIETRQNPQKERPQ
jgi:hypothetical protein